ncbi:MAG: Primosomal protein, partial [Actinomycetota bacterium]
MGVLLPSPVPHLDRPFDYAVPEDLRARVSVGCRVRVRFHGRLATGFVVEAKDHSDFDLQPITDVKGPP